MQAIQHLGSTINSLLKSNDSTETIDLTMGDDPALYDPKKVVNAVKFLKSNGFTIDDRAVTINRAQQDLAIMLEETEGLDDFLSDPANYNVNIEEYLADEDYGLDDMSNVEESVQGIDNPEAVNEPARKEKQSSPQPPDDIPSGFQEYTGDMDNVVDFDSASDEDLSSFNQNIPEEYRNKSFEEIQAMQKAKQKGEPVPEWHDELDFLKDPRANPIVAWPMRLFDCSPITDGAACLLIVAEELARDFTDSPICITGTGQGSDHALHEREDMTSIRASKVAAREAYEMAGVKAEDIQIAEVHDCFTIAELVATEDLGFFGAGEGYKAVEMGLTARDGSKPINPSGGLKSKGHPVGASGVGQVVEIWTQMRGEAGPRQVPAKEIRLALTHNVGATGGTCAVHIFERR